jgi:hypothetical protein
VPRPLGFPVDQTRREILRMVKAVTPVQWLVIALIGGLLSVLLDVKHNQEKELALQLWQAGASERASDQRIRRDAAESERLADAVDRFIAKAHAVDYTLGLTGRDWYAQHNALQKLATPAELTEAYRNAGP